MRPKATRGGRRALRAAMLAVAVAAGGCAADRAARGGPGADLDARRIDDRAISLAVQSQLVISPGIFDRRVEVVIDDGIVTLSGTVGSLRAKDRALELAEQVKGVRAVTDRLQVAPAARPSHQIVQDVAGALALEPALASLRIVPEIEGRQVRLTGQVDTWQERWLAADVVKGVRGVKAIDNELLVMTAGSRTDGEIKRALDARLRQDYWVEASLIDVAVESSKVTLSGTVSSAAEKSRVVRKAWVAGVREVDGSDLEVKWWARDVLQQHDAPPPTDQEIRQAVQDALRYDPRLAAQQLRVEVQDKVVTLSGGVATLQARRAASEEAMNIVGVARVNNRLEVVPPLALAQADVANRVQQVLSWDPLLFRYDLQVSVAQGRARLIGQVTDAYEKELAAERAGSVAGVLAVENNLVASSPATVKTDSELLVDIRERFFWSPYVDVENVDIAVNGGIVTLRGEVNSWAERHQAERNAQAAGAVAVKNELELRPGRAS